MAAAGIVSTHSVSTMDSWIFSFGSIPQSEQMRHTVVLVQPALDPLRLAEVQFEEDADCLRASRQGVGVVCSYLLLALLSHSRGSCLHALGSLSVNLGLDSNDTECQSAPRAQSGEMPGLQLRWSPRWGWRRVS